MCIFTGRLSFSAGGIEALFYNAGCACNAQAVGHREGMETPPPTISMREFFALPEIVALQEIQKRNPYGSDAHRKAFEDAKAIAATYGAAKFFGDY
jgi:hypothetical protein